MAGGCGVGDVAHVASAVHQPMVAPVQGSLALRGGQRRGGQRRGGLGGVQADRADPPMVEPLDEAGAVDAVATIELRQALAFDVVLQAHDARRLVEARAARLVLPPR